MSKQMSVNPLRSYLGDFQATGHLETDVKTLLLQRDSERTYLHVREVAAKAVELARQFGGNPEQANVAAWLHDISAVVPNSERVDLAKALGIEVLPEESQFPMILHQKLSVPVAKNAFGITDSDVLSATECHTTLKANASLTDKIVFAADKIAWDQSGTPPYLRELEEALEHSIDAAALVYLDYLWHMRDRLRVLHPWVIEARNDLLGSVEL